MGERTGISWTDSTWNPVRGCSRVSEGCRLCYAERVAARFSGPGQPYEGLADRSRAGSKWTGKVALVPQALSQPVRWTRPRRIFVNSMSDLFHEGLENQQIAAVFGAMALAPQHTFQVLTKRARRMREWVELQAHRGSLAECVAAAYVACPGLASTRPLTTELAHQVAARGWPLPNVHLGVSVENQAAAAERIPDLLATRTALLFLSCEPLLNRARLDRIELKGGLTLNALTGYYTPPPGVGIRGYAEIMQQVPAPIGQRIGWVIIGGESGPGARPMLRSWAEDLIQQCDAARVPVWFKQIGSNMQDGGWPEGIPGKGDKPEYWPSALRAQALPLE